MQKKQMSVELKIDLTVNIFTEFQYDKISNKNLKLMNRKIEQLKKNDPQTAKNILKLLDRLIYSNKNNNSITLVSFNDILLILTYINKTLEVMNRKQNLFKERIAEYEEMIAEIKFTQGRINGNLSLEKKEQVFNSNGSSEKDLIEMIKFYEENIVLQRQKISECKIFLDKIITFVRDLSTKKKFFEESKRIKLLYDSVLMLDQTF